MQLCFFQIHRYLLLYTIILIYAYYKDRLEYAYLDYIKKHHNPLLLTLEAKDHHEVKAKSCLPTVPH